MNKNHIFFAKNRKHACVESQKSQYFAIFFCKKIVFLISKRLEKSVFFFVFLTFCGSEHRGFMKQKTQILIFSDIIIQKMLIFAKNEQKWQKWCSYPLVKRKIAKIFLYLFLDFPKTPTFFFRRHFFLLDQLSILILARFSNCAYYSTFHFAHI